MFPWMPDPVPEMVATLSLVELALYREKFDCLYSAVALLDRVESMLCTVPRVVSFRLAWLCFFWTAATFCCSRLTN